MNLAYFRNSSHTYEETIQHVTDELKNNNITLIGTTELPTGNGMVFHISKPIWFGNVLSADKQLIGLIPTTIVVRKENETVTIGAGSAGVLSGVTQNPAIHQIADLIDKDFKTLIHTAAGVGPLKPKSITLYSTTTCPYCKMEASWLDNKKVAYKEVKVDLDPQAGEELVRKTGQMGVPVTEVEYENGEYDYIVGFDQHKLQEVVGGTA